MEISINQRNAKRAILRNAVVLLGVAILTPAYSQQQPKLKVGLLMSYTGSVADPSRAADNGFKLYLSENGGKIGGREVQLFEVDDESNPANAIEAANKLIKRDQVDVVIGPMHSGVGIALAKVAKETNTLVIVPNAAANELTGTLCAPNIFRVSFSSWQPTYAMGLHVAKKHKTSVTVTWKYAAGVQMVEGFKELFEKGGGKILKEMSLPFPNMEFQAYLTEIAAIKPESVYVFFFGAGATKFVKEYVAAGLDRTIPLYSPGFLTDGTLASMGDAGRGLQTTLHYADGLANPTDEAFRSSYEKAYKTQPDVYAMQGYDAAQLLAAGVSSVKGDMSKRAELIQAMETAKIASPRGSFTLSKSHNPIQDIYLRKSDGLENKLVETVVKDLADPGRGCKM